MVWPRDPIDLLDYCPWHEIGGHIIYFITDNEFNIYKGWTELVSNNTSKG